MVDESYAQPITAPQTKKKKKNNIIISKIINKRINGNLYINIIREKNLQRLWKTFC